MTRLFCRLVISVVGLVALTAVKAAEQSSTSAVDRDKWATRIESCVHELVTKNPTDNSKTAYDVALAAQGLAHAGKVDRALQLVSQYIDNERLKHVAIQYIADGQSAADDLRGALATAALLPEGYVKERTLKLIVARQAQRGDLRDAVASFAHISSTEERDKAVELTISACIDVGDLEQADQLLQRIEDEGIRIECRKQIRLARERPLPTDEDYTERMVARAVGSNQLGQREERFLRLICQVRAAAARDKRADRENAMREARAFILEWEASARIAPLLDLALLHCKFDETALARDLFRESLAAAVEAADGNPLVFLHFPSEGDFPKSIVRVMGADEVEQWIEKLANNPAANLVAASFVAALAANGMVDRADTVYERLKDPECRLYAAWTVLRSCANSSPKGR